MTESDDVTRLLEQASRSGDREAWSRLYALLYNDIRRIARSQIRRVRTPHISPTSLVGETWLRLARADVSAESREHVLSLAARAMRFVLLDLARRQMSDKHGHQVELAALDEGIEATGTMPLEHLLALDKALDDLARLDPRLAKVVELRYFVGLSEPDIAAVTGMNERTVRRDWQKARAYLSRRLGHESTPPPESSGA